MSLLLREAMTAVLAGDATLAGLMKSTVDDLPYRIVHAHRGRIVGTPDYPFITLTMNADRADANPAFSSVVRDEVVAVAVYDTDRGDRVDRIADRVRALFHDVPFPIPGSIPGFSTLDGGMPDGYNADTKEHFNVQLFHVQHTPR